MYPSRKPRLHLRPSLLDHHCTHGQSCNRDHHSSVAFSLVVKVAPETITPRLPLHTLRKTLGTIMQQARAQVICCHGSCTKADMYLCVCLSVCLPGVYIDTSNRNRVKQQQEEHELSDASDVEGDDEELVFMSMLYDRGALGVAIYNAQTTSLKMIQLQIHDTQELEQVTSESCVAVSLRGNPTTERAETPRIARSWTASTHSLPCTTCWFRLGTRVRTECSV